jgi:effector-binding domain-containing protein
MDYAVAEPRRRTSDFAVALVLCLTVLVAGCASKPRHRRPATNPFTRPSEPRPSTGPAPTLAASRPASNVSDLEIRTLPAQSFLYARTRTTYSDMQRPVEQIMADLGQAAADGRFQPAGPVTFVYLGAKQELSKAFDLDIGFPVTPGTRPFGRFKVRTLPAFRCASVTYTGPVTTIDKAYDRLIPAVQQAGLITTDETREIYLNWEGPDSPNDQVLVSIGLREGPGAGK